VIIGRERIANDVPSVSGRPFARLVASLRGEGAEMRAGAVSDHRVDARRSKARVPTGAERRIHIMLLGTVRGRVLTDEITLSGSQPRLVLAALARRPGSVVTADEIAEILWPEGRALHWEGAVRGVMSKVRSFLYVLDPVALHLDNVAHTYRLVCSADVTTDIAEAEAEVAAAGNHMAAGRFDEASAAAAVAAAILEDRLVPGHEGEWLDLWRSQLAALRRRALRLGSIANTARGNHDQAIELAALAVADDAYDEESHRVLMASHLAAGNRAAALRAYGTCRRVLADDLGVPPSPETEALYLRLLAPEPVGTTLAPRPTRRLLPLVSDRPFVGRDDELAAITSAWQKARGGTRQVVMLHGGAGIGKSRLGLEAIRLTGAANVLYGRSSAEQVIANEPFVEAIERHAERLGDDELARLVDGLEPDISALVSAVGSRLRRDHSTTGASPLRPLPIEAVTTLLARVASTPTVLALDDLHWADASSLMLLQHVVRRLDRSTLLVLITYRDDHPVTPSVAAALADLHRCDECRSIAVPGLSVHDVADLLRLTAMPNADQVGEELHRRTGGNCFYVTQVLSAAAESGEPFDPLQVPDTVNDVVRHRTATLSPTAQHLLAVAAVIGASVPRRRFDPAIRDVDGAAEGLEELIDRRFLLEDEHGDFGFAHVIVRDAVYGQLSQHRVRRLHAAMARALIAEHQSDDEPTDSVLAHHIDQATGQISRRSQDHWASWAETNAIARVPGG
jgi:DNA-binding SARP family transcriptional activator